MRYQCWTPFKTDIRTTLLVSGLLLLFLGGCEQKKGQRLTIDDNQPSPALSRAHPCTILIIGKDSIKESLTRQWLARHDSEFKVQTISEEACAAADFEIEKGVDIVIYPANLMIELIHRDRIVELGRSVYESDTFNKNDLLKHFRKSGIRYNSKTWAVPCGGALFGLLYQAKALASTESEVPETWSQLIRWGQRLKEQSARSAGPQTSSRIGIPLAEAWAARTFIAAAAPYARQKGRLSVLFERRTMKPLITSEGFVKALGELKSLTKLNPDCLELTPLDIFQSLLNGNLSAGITWPSHSASEKSGNNAGRMLLVHALPGSNTYFDESTQTWGTRPSRDSNVVNLHGLNNLLASQTKISRRPQSAVKFLNWLSESTISQTLFANDPQLGPFRVTHLGDVKAWIGDAHSLEFEKSFTAHLKEAHEHALIMTLPNILRQREYMEILDTEIRACLKSDLPAKQTLEKVAKQWDALTDSIGRKTQSDILRRNSNF